MLAYCVVVQRFGCLCKPLLYQHPLVKAGDVCRLRKKLVSPLKTRRRRKEYKYEQRSKVKCEMTKWIQQNHHLSLCFSPQERRTFQFHVTSCHNSHQSFVLFAGNVSLQELLVSIQSRRTRGVEKSPMWIFPLSRTLSAFYTCFLCIFGNSRARLGGGFSLEGLSMSPAL